MSQRVFLCSFVFVCLCLCVCVCVFVCVRPLAFPSPINRGATS